MPDLKARLADVIGRLVLELEELRAREEVYQEKLRKRDEEAKYLLAQNSVLQAEIERLSPPSPKTNGEDPANHGDSAPMQ